MKKFSGFLLICGGLLFIGGLLLVLTSMVLGSDLSLVQENLNKIGATNVGGLFEKREMPNYSDQYWQEWEADVPVPVPVPVPAPIAEPSILPVPKLMPEENPLPEQLPDEHIAYEIKNLDFDFGLGDVHIIGGEDFALIYGNNNTYHYFTEHKYGNTWSIKSNRLKWQWIVPWQIRQDEIKLTVVLPYDFFAENINIVLGAGNMQSQHLQALKMNIEVGLGNCQISGLNTENVKLAVGVGNLLVGNFTAAETSLEVGLGSIELGLITALEQYRCQVEVGLGNVVLGNNNYSGIADLITGKENAPYTLKVKCGLGSVRIFETSEAKIEVKKGPQGLQSLRVRGINTTI
ncbi:MAG: DUF4097 family beta strand repeat-containing protein [Firmicutes bacterium]|nr:DUF4097 family beta strand repeat-containing protein [Bacillota bacterium]